MADPQPTPISAAQQQLDNAIKPVDTTPLDVDQLVFKTMPKGYPVPKNVVVAKPSPAIPLAAITGVPAAATTAPTPAAVPSAPSAPSSGVSAGISSGASSPITSAPPQRSRMGLWAGLAVLIVAVVIAGYFSYTKFIKSSAPAPAVQQATPIQPDSSDTSTPPDTTSTTPPASTTTTTATTTSVLSAAWLNQYFSSYVINSVCPATQQSVCGDDADPDNDGLTNVQEFKANTDPTKADTDADGIADGDEVNIFLTNPITAHTSGSEKFTDAGDIKYKYNSVAKANFSDADLVRIASAIATYHLHAPTTTTLTQDIIEFYTNYKTTASTPTPQTTPAQ